MKIELRTPQIANLLTKIYLQERETKNIPSVLILGRAGIGKSEIIYETARKIAEKLGKEFVEYDDSIADKILANPDKYFVFLDLRLSEVEPTDLIGIPYRKDSYVEYTPLKYAKVLSMCDSLLFLDELTNVQRDDVLSSAYKIILDKRIGFVPIRRTFIVCAGNTSEHSSIARALPAPLLNRLLIIYASPPTIEEWSEYMDLKYKDMWCRRTLAYLMTNSSDFIKDPEAPEGFTNYPTPRSWTKLAVTLTNEYKQKFEWYEIESLCIGYLGEEIGLKFFKFLKYQVPSIQELLERPELYKKLDLDVKAIFVIEFADFVKRNKDKIFKIKGVSVECDSKVKKLIETILSDSEELTLLFIQSLGTSKYEITAKMLLAIPSVKEFLRKLKELREQIERQLGRPVE